jgi:hypothetical protein
MTSFNLASDLVSVVLKGNYRSIGISPKVLASDVLIGEVEAQEATYELLVPGEASVFQAAWLRCQIQAGSLELQTQQESEHERLRDVAVGILQTYPKHPISAMGINRAVHIPVKNRKAWHSIGDHLVNNEAFTGIFNVSGMRGVTYWFGRLDKYSGRIQVQVEPSGAVFPGVFITYNDHYDLTRATVQPTTRREADELAREEDTTETVDKIAVAIEVLTENWQAPMNRTLEVFERVFQQGE